MQKIFFFGCLVCANTVLALQAAKQVVVGPDDTVYGIAYNEGILTRALISANNLQPPYALTPGQVLLIPQANQHIASGKDSLQAIADTYAVNVDVLAHENNLPPAYVVRQGDTLIIPSRDTESIVETLTTSPPEISTTELAPLPLVKQAEPRKHSPELPSDIAKELAAEEFEPKPTPKRETKELSLDKKKPLPSEDEKEKKQKKDESRKDLKKEELKKEEKLETKAKKDEEKQKVPEKITFIWPVQGEVIKEFKAGSQDGIVIRVEEDSPVKAAAGGEVIYVGNEIKNLGNLILIKHPKSYITAYAHLSEALVKKGEKVSQGSVIANSGTAGTPSTGQLHFEIREGKKPVNPLEKLNTLAE